MLKKSPSRGQRSKGVRLKHILQIGLLLGVCFWLIYQVKHSHDKRKALNDNVAKISIKEQNSDLIRLGRKDLNPRIEEAKNEKHEEEQDDEEEIRGEDNKHTVEEHKEGENKHELHKAAGDEETKNEDLEDEGRGGGDDELDERDQEKNDGETDREEEFIDEEKEREDEEIDKDTDEKENEEGEFENESKENQDQGGDGESLHEAREEHYKADDASSEVAHDTQTETHDAEKLSLNSSNGDGEKTILEKNDNSNNTAAVVKQYDSDIKVEEVSVSGHGSSLGTKIEQSDGANFSNPLNTSLTNPTMTSQLNDQPGASNSSEDVNSVASVNSTDKMTPGYSQLNVSENQFGVPPKQRPTLDSASTGQAPKLVSIELNLTDSANMSSVSNDSSSNPIIFRKTEITESSNSSASADSSSSEKLLNSITEVQLMNSSDSTAIKENADTLLKKASSNNEGPIETNESKESSLSNDSKDVAQQDTHDSPDSSMLQDEKEVRTELGTLPEAEGNMGHEFEVE